MGAPIPLRPFALINATRCFLDLSDVRKPRFLNSETCPVCDAEASAACTYEAAKDRMVCECGERFPVSEG